MSYGDDEQPPQTRRQRQRSRSRERAYPHAQVPQEPQIQPMIIQEPVTDTVVNPSSSTGISPAVEQRDRSRRRQRSRSRERTPQRTPPRTPSQSDQGLQHVVPPPGEPQTHRSACQDTDGESEAVEPQSRISNRSTLLQKKIHKIKKGKKTKKEVARPNDLLPKCTSVWIQARTMKNLTMNQEPLQPFNLFYQCHLLIKDQQPVNRDQLPGPILRTKTVSIAMSIAHEVRTHEGQCRSSSRLPKARMKIQQPWNHRVA